MTDVSTTDGRGSCRTTLIVTPRERWGLAEASLASIIEHTPKPFHLIYVDGGMPSTIREKIKSICTRNSFEFVPTRRWLSPNEARNRGAQRADTEFVVFIDNDVMVSPGWLEPLMAEADASQADIVAPLTCQGEPLHHSIHQAGGTFAESAEVFFASPSGARRIDEQMHLQADTVDSPLAPREPFDTQLCEFHCALVRRAVFDQLGWLDEGMLATKEHLDFCMLVVRAGGRIRIEPRSLVTYVFPTRRSPVTLADYPYFILRWSPRWQLDSLEHFRSKWGLGNDPYFDARRDKVQWRHVEGIVRPVLRKVPMIGERSWWHKAGGKLLRGALRAISGAMVTQHALQRRREVELARNGRN